MAWLGNRPTLGRRLDSRLRNNRNSCAGNETVFSRTIKYDILLSLMAAIFPQATGKIVTLQSSPPALTTAARTNR
jgi:hypothetical protein